MGTASVIRIKKQKHKLKHNQTINKHDYNKLTILIRRPMA